MLNREIDWPVTVISVTCKLVIVLTNNKYCFRINRERSVWDESEHDVFVSLSF